MEQRNGDFRISKGRHVQLESELLSSMQRRLIGSEHERIERIMKEHRRALFLQLNGPNSTWRPGKVKAVKKETEHVNGRVSKSFPEQESTATDKAELSIRRDFLPSAQTQKSRGTQRYLGSSQSGKRKGHTTHDPSSRSEIGNENADTCNKSKLSPIFDETNERKTLNSNEYSAASSNNNELRKDIQAFQGLNGMDVEKNSFQQKADKNNVIYVTLETDVEKHDNICASEGKFTKRDKRGNIDDDDGLDQNHDLFSQQTELSLQNEKPLRHSQGNIVHKLIAEDADWAQASPPLTSIHDKLIKTNRFFAISRRTSNSTPQISRATPETQPTDDFKPTVLSNSSDTDSSTTQQRNVLFRDTSMQTKYEPREESKVDVLKKVETVSEGRKVTFQDDLHQIEPSASETIERAPINRARVCNSTESKKYDCKKPTTRQPGFSTMVKVENGPLKTGRFLFKGNGVTIPQVTDKCKSESFPPRLCSKNVWAPKVSITWEENEPMRVCVLPAEGSMRKRLTFREHKDLWPHVKIIVILRMLDGEHYYREIK